MPRKPVARRKISGEIIYKIQINEIVDLSFFFFSIYYLNIVCVSTI